jgi:hypothetical protein
MRALSIRQPFAELILRGLKTIEYRSRPTRIIGERFYIYAARGPQGTKARRHEGTKAITADNIVVPREKLPQWMYELAELFILNDLPRGVLVGTAKISRCDGESGDYNWHLTDVQRLEHPRKPKNHPQPAWFIPF